MSNKKTIRYRLAFALGYAQQVLYLLFYRLSVLLYRLATRIDFSGASLGAERALNLEDEDRRYRADYGGDNHG
jgi:hypothetical protein